MNSAQYRAALARVNGNLDRFNEKILQACDFATPPLVGGLLGTTLTAFLFEATTIPHQLSFGLGAALCFFTYVVIKFLIRNPHITNTIMEIIGTVLAILITPFLTKLFYRCVINFNVSDVEFIDKLMIIAVLLGLLVGCLMLIYNIPNLLKRLFSGKNQQAHLLFLLGMAALGWALWLQSGGHWQQMAVLDSPIVVPLLNWKIPFTDSLGFPFALLGFVHDPVASSLSVASQVPISALTLFAAAGLLFLFAEIHLHKSEAGIQPRFALLAFVLFWAAVFLDVALHWAGAPVLPPALILFNRAFAVLAFAVYLFWRRVAKKGEPVRGADGVFKSACDWAEIEGWKIAAWLLGVLWLAVQLSHVLDDGFSEQIKYILCGVLLAVPVRRIIGFKHEFDGLLSPYRNAQQLERESYQPPNVIATADETRRALGDD